MDPTLYEASIVAAFLGGVIALAAPCCVTFLLPAYLASAFRARYALLAMTLVFAAGVAVVLLPITLGVAAVSRLTAGYHSEVFLIGGLFLVILGIWSLAGRNLNLPIHRGQLGDRPTVVSVFSLGVFSGAASSCCAPVLAGVLTLSAMSSSLPQATGLGLAYVAGMVSPLVVIALLWEKFNLSNNIIVRGRPVALRAGRLRWRVHSTNLLAGVLFVAVGVFVIVSTFAGGLETSQKQTQLGEYLRRAAQVLIDATRGTPSVVFSIVLAGLVLYLVARAFGWRLDRVRHFRARRRYDHE
ncbi:MAG: cytochrome c biogenesis protein CcdA [Chloroflexi bacterium]|nr:cytochrome c biogenesis protein CcdA [Chloroflexota bacterium]